MRYELDEKEVQIVEKFRNLLPEFQAALDTHADTLFELQTKIFKELLKK